MTSHPIRKIAVGSLNPVKAAAVETMTVRVWPHAAVTGVAVPSGVRPMPLSDAECIEGARQRAEAARDRAGADLGVGLEGGVNEEPAGLLLVGWVAIVDRHGRCGLGGTARLPLPPVIAERIRCGEELGPLMDELLGETNVKQKGGAVAALTAGLVQRQETFAVAVAYALAPFVAADFYTPPNSHS